MIRGHLQKNSDAKRLGLGGRGKTEKCPGSAPDVANWLDKKSGDVMKPYVPDVLYFLLLKLKQSLFQIPIISNLVSNYHSVIAIINRVNL